MTTLDRWFSEVWDEGNVDAIDEILTPDALVHSLLSGNGEKTSDRAAYTTLFREFRHSLVEVRVKIEREVTDGEFTAARCAINVVPKERPAGGTPDGSPIHFTGLIMARERGGRIAEIWNHFDFESMYRQME